MTSFASSLQIVAVSAAIAWPLAAGVTVVAWSKARAAHRRRLLAEIEGGLRGMFRTIEAQPAPERLELVIETLEEEAALAPPPVRVRTPVAPAT